jgi:hypothetical protein
MKTRFLSTIVLLAAVATVSCNRDDNKGSAGKGGNAILRIVPKHHNVFKNLVDMKVYIRYNVQDAPSFYDDSVATVAMSDQPTAVFSGLKTGNYYIYGYGYDTSIKQNVKGGMPYTISSETTLDLTLPVTEVHQ